MQTDANTTETRAIPLYTAGHVAGVAIGSGLVFLICIPLIFMVVSRYLASRQPIGFGLKGMWRVVAAFVIAVVGCVVTTLAIGLAWGLNSELCCA
jgi:hypothetical protein